MILTGSAPWVWNYSMDKCDHLTSIWFSRTSAYKCWSRCEQNKCPRSHVCGEILKHSSRLSVRPHSRNIRLLFVLKWLKCSSTEDSCLHNMIETYPSLGHTIWPKKTTNSSQSQYSWKYSSTHRLIRLNRAIPRWRCSRF